MKPAYRIFLSGVSSEFAPMRQALAKDLTARGLQVREQDFFRQEAETDTLLSLLHHYIKECDAVVCLIGSRSGDWPKGGVTEELQAMLPEGITRASYTQWEFFIARHYRKRLSIYKASRDFKPHKDKPGKREDTPLQDAYLAHLREASLHYTSFTTVDQLCRAVLKEGWPDHSRPAPVRLPYASLGHLFLGRDDFMRELRARLQSGAGGGHARAAAIVNAVHGLGGIGKTRLAVEYAWQHKDEFSAVLAISAESPERLEQELAALCGPLVLDLPEQNVTEQPAQVAAALAWLRQNPGWFLILDNVDTAAAARAVEHLLASLHHGQVLITSRIGQWSGGVVPLELGVLQEKDAADFLLARTAPKRQPAATDAADAAALARALGGLALALEQAAAFILQRRLTLAAYLQLWQAHDAAVQHWHDTRLMKYPRPLATTWETTLTQLSPGAVALLRMLCWLAPDPLPLFVFEGEKARAIWQNATALLDTEPPPAGTTAPASPAAAAPHPAAALAGDIRASLAELADFSMITWDTTADSISLHRVVQEILRNRLPQATRTTWLQHSLDLLDAAAPADSNDVRTWPQWTPLAPHIAEAAPHGEAANLPQPTTRLMGALGLMLNAKAQHPQAEDWMRRALAMAEASYGPEHPKVAVALNNLAALLQATNRLAEAESLMRRALAMAEASYGPEHPNVATALNNLASLLQATNRLAEAEPPMRRALGIDAASYGPEHPNVANSLNNLAQLLHATNRLAEAEPLMRRALAIDEASFGPEHPKVATALNNLALLLYATNRLAEAEPLMRRALGIDEASYGPEHPDVARDLNNLAQLLQDTNRLAEAEPVMRRALGIDEASYGPEHPNVARDLNNLAALLQDTNRLAEAEPLMRRVVSIFETAYGPEHPEVAAALNNLAQLLKATNRLAEAEPLLRRALTINEASYGPEHPKVAAAFNNLARLLQDTNRLAEAEPLMRRAVKIYLLFAMNTGHPHPHLQTVIGNYLRLLIEMGLSEEAIQQRMQELRAEVEAAPV